MPLNAIKKPMALKYECRTLTGTNDIAEVKQLHILTLKAISRF